MRTTVPFPSKWQNHVFSSHLFFLHMNNILVRVQTHSFLTVWVSILTKILLKSHKKKRFFKLPGIWQFHKFFGLFVNCKARVSSDNYVKALNFDRELAAKAFQQNHHQHHIDHIDAHNFCGTV